MYGDAGSKKLFLPAAFLLKRNLFSGYHFTAFSAFEAFLG